MSTFRLAFRLVLVSSLVLAGCLGAGLSLRLWNEHGLLLKVEKLNGSVGPDGVRHISFSVDGLPAAVRDEDLIELSSLMRIVKVQSVSFRKTHVSDIGIREVLHQTQLNLVALYLDETEATPEIVDAICDLEQLRTLTLPNCFLSSISRLTNMERVETIRIQASEDDKIEPVQHGGPMQQVGKYWVWKRT